MSPCPYHGCNSQDMQTPSERKILSNICQPYSVDYLVSELGGERGGLFDSGGRGGRDPQGYLLYLVLSTYSSPSPTPSHFVLCDVPASSGPEKAPGGLPPGLGPPISLLLLVFEGKRIINHESQYRGILLTRLCLNLGCLPGPHSPPHSSLPG